MSARGAFLVALIAVAIVIPACFQTRNDVVQVESKGHVQFQGNVEGARATVTLDGQLVIADRPIPKERTSFVLRPGTYHVQVVKGDQVVVNRRVYVADGTTVEVRVP